MHTARRALRGFTLVEVLIALTALALMAGMSWQSVAQLVQARERNQQRASALDTLQATLLQWETDLNAVTDTEVVSAVDFDGKRLRITRREAPPNPGQAPSASLRVVAWSVEQRDGQTQLFRWQSQPVQTRAQVEAAWQQAAVGSVGPKTGEIQTIPVSNWSVVYFRGNAWVNPLSASEQANAQALADQARVLVEAARRAAAGAPTPVGGLSADPRPVTALGALPDAIRLQISLPVGSAGGLTGSVTKDWIRPNWIPGAS